MELKDAFKKYGNNSPVPESPQTPIVFKLKTPPQEIYKPVKMIDISRKGIKRFNACPTCGQPVGGELKE